ncbi:Hypothetical protein SMAX5B_013242 [Scophthalmus maximus]|uniref:Uncharacterized protein n=1 Tax=Scophthalmus maximus TaxID=52904 RepID=A0A2U9B6J3_SCOMX|nr:Hypothetical protein SMAX5B_013242 [Scophthalmus maximus]
MTPIVNGGRPLDQTLQRILRIPSGPIISQLTSPPGAVYKTSGTNAAGETAPDLSKWSISRVAVTDRKSIFITYTSQWSALTVRFDLSPAASCFHDLITMHHDADVQVTGA